MITTRKAEMKDLDDLLAIEESAIPGYGYMYDDRFFFLENQGNTGKMTIAYVDGVPAGMGQYSVMPDGSGWLEILRVKKEYQKMGVGTEIYKEYMRLADETNAQSVAMFTGRRNIGSKHLAENYGFHLAAAMVEYYIEPKEAEEVTGFRVVEDPAEATALISRNQASWGRFMAMNRTFMHYGEDLYRYLTERKMVYTDGESVIVLGCRMLEHRGWFIGYMDGDLDRCLAFAKYAVKEKGLPRVTISIPPEREDLKALLLDHGYTEVGELIVMEWERNAQK